MRTREGPSIRFAHTNIVAHDWRELARFYARDPEGNLIELQNWADATARRP